MSMTDRVKEAAQKPLEGEMLGPEISDLSPPREPVQKSKALWLASFVGWLIAAPFKFVFSATFGRGMLGFTTVLSVFFAGWMYYFFEVAIQRPDPTAVVGYGTLGIFVHARIMQNLAWFAVFYIPIGVLSAALYPMDMDVGGKGRRLWGPILNHGTSLLTVGIMGYVLLHPKTHSLLGGPFAEAAIFATIIAFVEFVTSFVISLIVANSRKRIA